ncbi:hypothetical protein KVT40_006962 [Elsinoe batatas]|uniref:Telomere replication protein EST3 n=1 Tax=Elsinoe batatas TaxID=2601811 RepID=A0A8K0KW82_9PEZI|nr:hypothetical protein KVT40_006962 [Elsinoe batatas]
MANSLREWLKPTIAQAFQEGLIWRKSSLEAERRPKIKSEISAVESDPDADQDSDGEDDNFMHDGSNLRIDLTRSKGQNNKVQLLRIRQRDTVYLCEFSDGHHMIRGQIPLGAQLERDTGLQIPQLEGGIISVISFRLVLTPLGNSDSQFLLEVRDAKYRKGALGAGFFGHPKPIWQEPELRSLLLQLGQYDNTESSDDEDNGEGDQPQSQPQPTVVDVQGDEDELRSQGSGDSLSEIPRPASQLQEYNEDSMFATQLPVDLSRRTLRRPGPHAAVSVNGASNLSRPEPPKRNVDKQDEVSRQKAMLLRNLQTSKPTTARPVTIPKSVLTIDLGDDDDVVVLESGPRTASRRHTSDSESKAPPLRDQTKHNESAIAVDRSPPTTNPAKAIVDLTSGSTDGQPASGTRASKTQPPDSSKHAYAPRMPDAIYMKYASRRMPSNQRDILQKKQSWYPPYPGEVFPQPNVPVDVLKSLTHRLDQEVIEPAGLGDHGEAIDQDAISIATTPVRSAGSEDADDDEIPWSQSPNREQTIMTPSKSTHIHMKPLNAKLGELPPDSSAPEPSAQSMAPASSPPKQALSPVSQDDEISEDDNDLDLGTAVPRTLGASNSAPVQAKAVRSQMDDSVTIPSSAPAIVSPAVEVKESPLKSSTEATTQSTGEPIPATQPLPGNSSGQRQPQQNHSTAAPHTPHPLPQRPTTSSSSSSVYNSANGRPHYLVERTGSVIHPSRLKQIQDTSPLARESHSNGSRHIPQHRPAELHSSPSWSKSHPRDRMQTSTSKTPKKRDYATFGKDTEVESGAAGRGHQALPHKKQRSGIIWGSQDVVVEPPEIKHRNGKREAFNAFRREEEKSAADKIETSPVRHSEGALPYFQPSPSRSAASPSNKHTTPQQHTIISVPKLSRTDGPSHVVSRTATPSSSLLADRNSSTADRAPFPSPRRRPLRDPAPFNRRGSLSSSGSAGLPHPRSHPSRPSSSAGPRRGDSYRPSYSDRGEGRYADQSVLDTINSLVDRLKDDSQLGQDTVQKDESPTASDDPDDSDEYMTSDADDDVEDEDHDHDSDPGDTAAPQYHAPTPLPLRFADSLFGDFARLHHNTPVEQQAREQQPREQRAQGGMSMGGKIDVLSWKIGK